MCNVNEELLCFIIFIVFQMLKWGFVWEFCFYLTAYIICVRKFHVSVFFSDRQKGFMPSWFKCFNLLKGGLLVFQNKLSTFAARNFYELNN